MKASSTNACPEKKFNNSLSVKQSICVTQLHPCYNGFASNKFNSVTMAHKSFEKEPNCWTHKH